MKRLLDYDPISRIRRWFHHTPGTEEFAIETEQLVDDVVETNKGVFNQIDERARWKGDMHRVASIPMNVYMDLVQRGIAQDERAFRRWLDDPDNAVFRTRPGKLSR